jgi:DNA-binding MarR family transcriptional regulator
VNSSVSARDTAPADDALHPAAAVFDLVASLIRLTPRDMTLTSLSTLATLSRKGPRRITELAASEGVTQPSVTALVTALERAGLVERRSDPADRRVVLVALTEAGAAYLRVRRQASAAAVAQAVRGLEPEDFTTLVAAVPVLERLRALLEEAAGSADRQGRDAAALPTGTPFPVSEL